MEIERSTNFLLFRQKRQDVALLYDLYFDYVSSQMRIGSYIIPDRFVLVAAFACMFYDLKLVSGYSGFASSVNQVRRVANFSLPPHHWLTWGDENHIIDLLPVDGMFGVSTPQAVFQKDNRCRFFASKTIFPIDWDNKKKMDFHKKVNEVSSVLESLIEKVPF